jgi:hypothetical protein
VINWYNKGTFPTVNLEYKAATTLPGLGVASYQAITWSCINNPTNGISSYTWTVADPDAGSLPTEALEYYYVQLKVSSTADPTVYAESNAFKISYYNITWVLKDSETISLLSGLGVRSTAGSTVYWNVATGDLTSEADPRYAGSTFPHRYPKGTFTTIWSKVGYFDTTDQDRQITQDATYTVLMESTTPKEYHVNSSFSYDETKDKLMAKTWLEKSGALVNSDSANLLGVATIEVYYGTTLIGTLTDSEADPTTGYYYFEAKNATGEVGVADENGDLGFGLIAGNTYFAKCNIKYGGTSGTRSTHSSGASFDISVQQSLATATAQIVKEIVGVQTNLTARIATTQAALESKIASESAATQTKVTEVKTETAKILTAAETTLPAKITTMRDELTTSLETEIKPFVQSGILNRESAVKSGETVVISYRTTTGLSPVIDVYDSKNVKKISAKAMIEKGTTGIYEYPVKFLAAWGTGDFTVVCSESTKGTVDALTISVYTTNLEEVSSQVSAVLGSTTGITGLKTVADTLNSQFGLIDEALTKLSQSLVGKAEQAKGMIGEVEAVYNQLVEISKQIEKMSGSPGINLKKLYEVAKDKKDDMMYIRNKTEELKAAMDLNSKMVENVARKPVVQTWFEFK